MSHYFENDKNLKSEEKIIFAKIGDEKLSFFVDHGVFSKKGLDFGTRSLLENINIEAIEGNVLDFCCGYGPIGINIEKISSADVDMVDINDRSLHLSQKNVVRNEVRANVFKSDLYEKINKKYRYIITNPPIRVGKQILYQILFEAKEYLEKDGELWFVIHKDQGAKSVVKDLQKEYLVTLISKNKGFYVIKAKSCWQILSDLLKL